MRADPEALATGEERRNGAHRGPSLGLVLVSDDDASIRASLRAALEAEGYDVLEASDGDECLSLLHRHDPDLVVLDIDMPGVSGDQVLRLLAERRSDLPVVVITGLARLPRVMTTAPAHALLRKPFSLAAFFDAVARAMTGRGRAGHGPGRAGPGSAGPGSA